MCEQGGHLISELGAESFEHVVDGLLEPSEVGEVFVRQGLLPDELPDPFDQVQVGRVGWQTDQADVVDLGHGPDKRGVLVAGVVQHDVDRFVRMGESDFVQQPGHGFVVDRFGGGFPDQPVTDGVDSPEHAVALSSGGGGDHESDEAPEVAEERSADEVGGIDEIDLAPTRDGLVQQGFQSTIPKLVLGLQVDVGGNAPGLAVLQAQSLLKKAAPA